MERIIDSNQLNVTGSRIKQARLDHHMSQQQLSEQLQLKGIYVCRGSISRIENGSRIVTDFELGAIAEILGVTPSVFFGLEDKNPKD